MSIRKTTKTSRNPRRAPSTGAPAPEGRTKLELIVARLTRPGGATLDDLVAATGWQAHSIRGALAGSLRKKGLAIVSEKVDGARRYRIGDEH